MINPPMINPPMINPPMVNLQTINPPESLVVPTFSFRPRHPEA